MGYVNGATAAGAMPVLAVYALPHRDCGSFAAGGFGSGDAYRQWIDGVASTVGGTPTTFIVEPDALDMADCLSGGQRDERYSLIRYAIDLATPRITDAPSSDLHALCCCCTRALVSLGWLQRTSR
jgi:endoglucanase